MTKPKSAEEILDEMPSGEALFTSLAKELNLDLGGKTSGETNTVAKDEQGPSNETGKPKRQSKKSEAKGIDSSANRQNGGEAQPNSEGLRTTSGGEQGASSDDAGAGQPGVDTGSGAEPSGGNGNEGSNASGSEETPTVKPKRTRKSQQPTGTEQDQSPTPTPEVQPKVTAQEKKAARYSEWNGYQVNYMGKPMDAEGKFLTLPKRYDAASHEQFRATNGCMKIVVTKNAEGKVTSVDVYKQLPDGTRDRMPTDGVITNPYRMENRCRMYAHLFQVAYTKKTDWEEIAV